MPLRVVVTEGTNQRRARLRDARPNEAHTALASGVMRSPDHTMEQLVAVARNLRERHGF